MIHDVYKTEFHFLNLNNRTLIAKIYHIYRIFNNVFITKTVVSDRQLIRVAGCFFVFNSVSGLFFFSKLLYLGRMNLIFFFF
jgi:hypothetical protein